MFRKVEAAAASFAVILDRMRFGIEIAAMISMIATTINSSIKEKPLARFISPNKAFLSPIKPDQRVALTV